MNMNEYLTVYLLYERENFCNFLIFFSIYRLRFFFCNN